MLFYIIPLEKGFCSNSPAEQTRQPWRCGLTDAGRLSAPSYFNAGRPAIKVAPRTFLLSLMMLLFDQINSIITNELHAWLTIIFVFHEDFSQQGVFVVCFCIFNSDKGFALFLCGVETDKSSFLWNLDPLICVYFIFSYPSIKINLIY